MCELKLHSIFSLKFMFVLEMKRIGVLPDDVSLSCTSPAGTYIRTLTSNFIFLFADSWQQVMLFTP